MKNKKSLYTELLILISAAVLIVVGVLIIVLLDNNRAVAFGGFLVCVGAFFLMIGALRLVAMRSVSKQERKLAAENRRLEQSIDDALKKFEGVTDYPQKNTLKIVGLGLEFYADGRYACEKDRNGVRGYHFAFEIGSTDIKHVPENCDDVCDIQGCGVTIAAGYFDGIALESDANANGIILQDAPCDFVGRIIKLKHGDGYSLDASTVESDDISFGFVKILSCENDVLTVYFSVNVPFGLSDTVEGTVELKKDGGEKACDIDSLIYRIKRKRYNVIEVSEKELQDIERANPFLPHSYLTFLSKVGFADLDYIDIGRNRNTPTNLDPDELEHVEKLLRGNGNKRSTDDLYFIGIDSDDRYYAFSRKPYDGKVYVVSEDSPAEETYESFEQLLSEAIDA